MSRVSYRSHPVLKDLFNKDLSNLKLLKEDVDKFDGFKKSFHRINNEFLNNYTGSINIISESFVKKVNSCMDSLNKISLSEEIQDYVVFSMGNIVVLFSVISDPKIKYLTSSLTILSKEGNILCYGLISNNKILSYVSDSMKYNFNQLWASFFNILTLKKYAKIETVESKAKSEQTFAGCKYLNETDLDIEYLDSKWFTTLLNSQGFKVRGFFRLQPKKKNGEWTKELIWIDEFEKQGYNRQAKILNQDKPL